MDSCYWHKCLRKVGKMWNLLAKYIAVITFRFLHISFISRVIYSSLTASSRLKVLPAFLELDWTNKLLSVCSDTCLNSRWHIEFKHIYPVWLIMSINQQKYNLPLRLDTHILYLIAVWHSNPFLWGGLVLSACFPGMFWYQWTRKAKVRKKDQVKLTSD